MSDEAKKQIERQAIEEIRKHAQQLNAQELSEAIIHGDRSALSQSITLLESTNEHHEELAADIIRICLPHSGNSIRIGITGVPGVGKSTLIDVLGCYLISLGKKVAVLAIDPTSPISKGSILGDKTRMENLSLESNAFIRPSPAAETLGGVTRKTREAIILCEAAGMDVILIETVGVGQSETAVHGMTDFFLLLMLAGAGDQLQGIKRGIMEMCDAMLITKADGANLPPANVAKAEFTGALHLFPAKESGWIPQVEICSAVEKKGLTEIWSTILMHEKWMKDRSLFIDNRNQQDVRWMHEAIREKIITDFYSSQENISRIKEIESLLLTKNITAYEAANLIFSRKN